MPFDSVRGTYQTTLLAGLADAASRREVSLAVFAGGVIGAGGTEGLHRNFVFDLCDADSIDAAVILGGALGNALGPSVLDALCARLAPLPMASLALGPSNIPCLTLDEEPGMRQGLDHLLTRHGCRRLAFIRGPSVNAEAERRYAIYRAVLTERGLPMIRPSSARETSRRPPVRRRSSCWSTSAGSPSTPWWPATTTWRWGRWRPSTSAVCRSPPTSP